MGKTRCVRLNKNLTYDDKNFKKDAGGNIEDGKSQVGYTPMCVFSENKPRRKFWRSAKSLILFVEDALHALTFADLSEDLQLAWGKAEAREYLFKLEALAQVEVKPFKMWQFFVIILMLIVAIGVGIANLQKLGALGL